MGSCTVARYSFFFRRHFPQSQNNSVSPGIIISIHKTEATNSKTLKPTVMKHFTSIRISISCVLITLLSISCKKDPVIANPPPCTTCSNLNLSTMLINDSNWVRQDNGEYTSDITWIIERSGASISQVHEINISDVNVSVPIFPVGSANFMNGTMYSTVDFSKNHGSVTLTFELSKEEHEGEVNPATPLPFKSVEIEVLLLNRNN